MNRLPNELEANIDAKVEALVRTTYGTHYEPLIDRKRQEVQGKQQELESTQQELEALELEYSQAVERYVERLRVETPRSDSLRSSTTEQSTVERPRESHAAQNGSAGLPTRRKMLLSALPEFKGVVFERRDLDAKIIERYPDAKPETKAEHKNFSSANARLLADLVSKGKLRATKGEGQFDPAEYQIIENNEDTLLRSGP